MSAVNAGKRAKTKGTNYERDFAKRLSLWWTYGQLQDAFWRTSLSGGKATITNSTVQVGDICAIRPIAIPLENCVVFELKRGYTKTLILDWLLLGSTSLVGQWWEKGIQQSIDTNRKFILIVKHDHYPEVAFMQTELIPSNPPRKLIHNGGVACFVLEDVLWHQDPLTVANLLLDPRNLKRYEKESRSYRTSMTKKSTKKSLQATSEKSKQTRRPAKGVVRKTPRNASGGGPKLRSRQTLKETR